VILAKTIKGFGMGKPARREHLHQQKKMDETHPRFRDRFNIPVADDQLEELP
jgi:pyruvate dehydrogenase E1 component